MSLADSRKFSYVMIGRTISSGLQALFYLIFAAMGVNVFPSHELLRS